MKPTTTITRLGSTVTIVKASPIVAPRTQSSEPLDALAVAPMAAVELRTPAEIAAELHRDEFYENALREQQARVLTPQQFAIARVAIGRS